MPVNTAIRKSIATVAAAPSLPRAVLETIRWRPRHLLSSFSDRRSLRKIGGLGAYLTQVRWSVWWALRRCREC